MPNHQEVTVNYDGRQIRATFELRGGSITVRAAQGSKTTQLGGSISNPESLARMLLRELARDGKA